MSRHIGIGDESTYGTAVAPTEFIEATNCTLGVERTFEDIQTIRGYSTRQVNGLTSVVRGDITTAGNYQDIGLLLKQLYGSVDTTGAGPYTHTFPASTGMADREDLSCTVEVKRDSATRTSRFAGCKVTGWSLTATTDQSPQHTFSFVGKSETTGTAATASWPDFDPMVIGDVTISIDATSQPAKSFSLNVQRPVDEPFKIGSDTFAAQPIDSAVTTVEGEMTLLLTDTEMTEYAKYDGSTAVDVSCAITDGTHSLTINLNTCKLTQAAAPLSGRDRAEVTFTFKSYFDTTATENIQTILINDDAVIP